MAEKEDHNIPNRDTSKPHAIWYFSEETQQLMCYDPTQREPCQDWKSTFYPTEVVHQLERERDALKRELAKTVTGQVEAGESSRKRLKDHSHNVIVPRGKNQEKCRYCHRPNHQEKECWKKAGKCLCCGSPEHQLRHCPKGTRKSGNQPSGGCNKLRLERPRGN